MNNFGFIRVAACSPKVRPADIDYNVSNIIEMLGRLTEEEVGIAVFPELSDTAYTCADLFGQDRLLGGAMDALEALVTASEDFKVTIVVGAPIRVGARLYNCAVVVKDGAVLGIVPKSYIPNYGEFYERRWFAPGLGTSSEITLPIGEGKIPFGTDLISDAGGVKFGIEICEDLWVPCPPSTRLSEAGAEIILNLSATDELIGKHRYLLDLVRGQSARCRCAYVYASAGAGESSTDLAIAGNCIIAENGTLLAQSERFVFASKYVISDVDVESLRHDRIHFNPFLDENPDDMRERCDEISSIQAWGLAVRLRAIGCRSAVVGISGGLDSTLALLVTVKAFDMLGLAA